MEPNSDDRTRRQRRGSAVEQTPPGRKLPIGESSVMRGSLEDCALPELLQFLNGLRKSGNLMIERRFPRQSASIYFDEGRVVHAYCPPLQGEECVYNLLTWRSGRFVFIAAATPERRTVDLALGNLLLEGARRHDELAQVLDQLPPVETVLHREYDGDKIASLLLMVQEWKLLGAIDGRRRVGEIIEFFGADHAEVGRMLVRLIARGLVRTDADCAFLSAIVAKAGSGEIPAEAKAGDPRRTILAHADGKRSLAEILARLDCHPDDFITHVRSLIAARQLELVAGHEEYRRFLA